MLYPVYGDLIDKTGSRYGLVIAVTKRARELMEGSQPLVRTDSDKVITVATEELAQNKLHVKM